MQKKICNLCKIEKELSEFYKKSGDETKYRGICKKCMNNNAKNYSIKNHDIISEKNKKKRIEHPEINKLNCKKFREKNPDAFKKWIENNKEKRKKYINEYNSNTKIKFKNSLRSRINELMNKKYKNPKTKDLLGCDYDFLIKYIENKFLNGMSWENYGYYGWHIDHIIPLSTAKDEKEIVTLFHYTNLQPLWAKENLKKSNKI